MLCGWKLSVKYAKKRYFFSNPTERRNSMCGAVTSDFQCLFMQYGSWPEVLSNPILCESSFSGLGEPLGFSAVGEGFFSPEVPISEILLFNNIA